MASRVKKNTVPVYHWMSAMTGELEEHITVVDMVRTILEWLKWKPEPEYNITKMEFLPYWKYSRQGW